MRLHPSTLAITCITPILAASSPAYSAGFQLAEYAANGLGRAYAGEAAMADNASAQWRNPALLSELPGVQLSFGAIYVDPNVRVNGTVTHGSNTYKAYADDYASSAVIPNLYASYALSDQTVVGLALGTNYGMETDLSNGFAASHYGDQAKITTQEMNLNLAYEVSDAVSFGAGIRYVMAEGYFGASMPSHSAMFANSTAKYMEGDTTAWAWQAGIAWQIDPNHKIGVAYKSEVDLSLEGTATGFGFSLGLASGATSPGYLPLTLPATAELASFHQLTEQWALHSSINWTNWASFKELQAHVDGVSLSNSMVKEEHWHDNYRFALGSSYQASQKWLLRTGIAYDMSAVSDKNRSATIPETDRLWLSLGSRLEWSPSLSFDLGITYILAKDAPINEPRGYDGEAASATLAGDFVGEVTGDVWLIGIQTSYRF